MAHVDDPDSPLPDILKMLRKGDVFTHFLNGHPHGVLDANRKILPEVFEARQRGVIFDPCQGLSHLSFDVAEKCLDQNFLPDTIGTDLPSVNAYGPVYDLPTLMSKFMPEGIGLEKVIEMVTAKPAQVFDYGVPLGTLKPGTDADSGIFELHGENAEWMPGGEAKLSGHQMLVSNAVVRQGQFFVNEESQGPGRIYSRGQVRTSGELSSRRILRG